MNPEIQSKIIKEAHIKWLSKAETARINGSEMTVLTYGYLSQAIEEALTLAITKTKEEMLEIIKPIITKHIDRAFDAFSSSNGYWEQGEMKDVNVVSDRILNDLLTKLK